MRKEALILFFAAVIATIFSLAALRLCMPQLFVGGIIAPAADMQFVQLAKKVPAFFDHVFATSNSESTSKSDAMILKDPLTSVRGVPFFPEIAGIGPHDILGFRNREVPHVADIITIGDSMTYGNNVILSESWPKVLRQMFDDPNLIEYSMATGGWGAVQYLDMFKKALKFKPKVIVVTFYSGNDPLESFRDSYRRQDFKDLQVDSTLTLKDMPAVIYPAPSSQFWRVNFKDGSSTVFTPEHRFQSNDTKSTVVRVGYEIIKLVSKQLSAIAETENIKLVLSVIPTKEAVFLPRLEHEQLVLRDDYKALVEAELFFRKDLYEYFVTLQSATVVDPLPALQNLALEDSLTYPPDANGHPLAAGYRTIAEVLYKSMAPLLPRLKPGVYQANSPDNKSWYYLIDQKSQVWLFANQDLLEQNHWKISDATQVKFRDIEGLRLTGVIR